MREVPENVLQQCCFQQLRAHHRRDDMHARLSNCQHGAARNLHSRGFPSTRRAARLPCKISIPVCPVRHANSRRRAKRPVRGQRKALNPGRSRRCLLPGWKVVCEHARSALPSLGPRRSQDPLRSAALRGWASSATRPSRPEGLEDDTFSMGKFDQAPSLLFVIELVQKSQVVLLDSARLVHGHIHTSGQDDPFGSFGRRFLFADTGLDVRQCAAYAVTLAVT